MRNSKKSDKEGQCLLLPGGSRDKSWACPVATEALGIPSAHRTHRAGATSPPRALGWMSSNHSEGTETYIEMRGHFIPLDFALNCKHQNGTFY